MCDLGTGWLSPDGSMYPCDRYSHISTATEITRKFNYFVLENADETLIDNGWCHISPSVFNSNKLNINWKHFLTELQKLVLKQYIYDDETFDEVSLIRLRFEID